MATVDRGRKLSFLKCYYIIYEFTESESILKNQFICMIEGHNSFVQDTKTFVQKESASNCSFFFFFSTIWVGFMIGEW